MATKQLVWQAPMVPEPIETEWRLIRYHPGPLMTRTSDYHALEYWKTVYGPATRVEVNVEKDRAERDNFMGHLRGDIPIVVVPDPDRIEEYAEPLAQIHKQFWDAASTVVWTLYRSTTASGRRTPHGKWGTPVHSALADTYWDGSTDNQYLRFTPRTWVARLNRWLQIVATNPVRSDADLEGLRRLLQSDAQAQA